VTSLRVVVVPLKLAFVLPCTISGFLFLCRPLRLKTATGFCTVSCRLASMATAPITIPDGYTLHTENTSHVLLPSTNEAFLNPVQEFNRDLSVACIRTWSEELDKAKETKWMQTQQKRLKIAEAGSDKKRVKSESIDLQRCKIADKAMFQRKQVFSQPRASALRGK
jgi:tRNA G26 N,N-dimethylase Trm1